MHLKSKIAALLFCFLVILSAGDALIPREQLFHQPEWQHIKISPDGNKLAYVISDREGTFNIFTSNDFTSEPQQVTFFSDPIIWSYNWSGDGQKILFQKDSQGTRQFHLYCLDLATKESRDLTPQFTSSNAKVFKVNHASNTAIVGFNERNPNFHDVYLFDFATETFQLVYQNDGFIGFVFDEQNRIAVKLAINSDSSVTYFTADDKTLFELSADDAFHTEPLTYDSQEKVLYLVDNRASNTTKLKKINIHTKQEEVLGHHNKSDIHNVVFDAGKPIAYSIYYQEQEWFPLTKAAVQEFALLQDKFGSNYSITDQNSRYWIIKTREPDQGLHFWLYHRIEKTFTLLKNAPPDAPLSKMYSYVIQASDGKELVSYLTLPLDKDANGKPSEPLPLVVIPHGGPFKARDFYAYSPFHQWLASRGYAVLSVNFRLSSGFGKEFVNAGNGQWGKRAHQDVVDAVAWCIQNNIALRDKTAVFGISYGGYEALASLAFTPDTFACAIAICGPSHLKTVLDHVPFYWEIPAAPLSDHQLLFTKQAFIKSMGPDLESSSPLNDVSQIKKPLLLVHGQHDPIVASSESDQIFQTMQNAKLPVMYLSYPDEGHGIKKRPNNLAYLAYSEWLLAQVLHGQFEPLPNDVLKQSSAPLQSFGLFPNLSQEIP